jgi:hypothetical protein
MLVVGLISLVSISGTSKQTLKKTFWQNDSNQEVSEMPVQISGSGNMSSPTRSTSLTNALNGTKSGGGSGTPWAPGYGQGLGVLAPANNPYSSPNQPAAPAPAPAYQAPSAFSDGGLYSGAAANTPSFGIGSPDSGSYGGGGSPAPQSKPVMSESDWLAGDSEYQNQLTEFGTTLQDFLTRLTKQRSDFTEDYNTASKGLDRNETQGLLGVGEDFTNRGLANSGLFANSRKEAQTGFQNQRDGMKTAKTRAESDFQTQENDKRSQTDAAKGNAKRSSLSRMAMNQAF